MKKISLAVLLVSGIAFSTPVFAASGSGACSWHSGVDCAAGSDYDDSVICNDGWRDSTVAFKDVCNTTSAYTFIDDCNNYYALLHDFDAIEANVERYVTDEYSKAKLRLQNEVAKSKIILTATTCPVVYQGYIPQGQYSYDVCPIYSEKNPDHGNQCQCSVNFFSFAGKCESGWDYCHAQYGQSMTWDTYTKQCTCISSGDIYDNGQKRCITPPKETPYSPTTVPILSPPIVTTPTISIVPIQAATTTVMTPVPSPAPAKKFVSTTRRYAEDDRATGSFDEKCY